MNRSPVRFPRYLPPLLITAALAAFVLVYDLAARQRHHADERASVLSHLSTIRAQLEGGLNSRLFLSHGLATYAATHPDVTPAEFRPFARGLTAGHTGIRSLQLARNTVISHVYPLAHNRAALGLDLLHLPGQREAVQRALDTRGTVVAGPVHLVQGGVAFISRTPVYLPGAGGEPGSGAYWGLAIILIDTEALLREAGLTGRAINGLRVALRGKDGLAEKGGVFYGDPALFQGTPVNLLVTFPNGAWQLAGVPDGGWTSAPPYAWWWRAGGLLMAVLGGMVTWLWARYPVRLWREVQLATTELRRGQAQLESKVAERTTELVAANAALRESEARLAEAQHIAHIGNWEWDVATDSLHWSDEVYRIFGVRPGEFNATYDAFLDRVHPEDRSRVRAVVREALEEGRGPYGMDHRIVLPSGRVRTVHEQGRVDYDSDGRPVRMAGTVQDITDRKNIELQLEHMAYHDSLTGLPNRALMRDRLSHALAKARRVGGRMAVLFLDLDRFKTINDSLGHDAGDRLLRQVSDRLERHKREEDTLARLGGDEFTLLLEDVVDAEHAAAVAIKLHGALREGFRLDGRELFVTASVGISMYPGDGDDADTLMKHADAAMYRAKEMGRDGYHFYSRELSQQAEARLQLESDLRRALDGDALQLHFQPIVDLTSGRIAAFEALVRWQHPQRGLLAPAEFIPLAEESGLCMAIGRKVLRLACAQSRDWHDAGVPRVRIMVNLSARQFGEDNLAGDIAALLTEHGLRPSCLGLEITEHVLLKDDERVNTALRNLHELGVPVAIDDFGQGHSALAYLKRLTVSTLKIDRSFVRDLTTDPNDAAIVEAVVAMGHTLKLTIVAEGVETAEQAERLRAAGCDLGQGYLFKGAVPADQVPALIARCGVLGDGCAESD